MNLYEKIKSTFDKDLSKNAKTIFLIIYAVVMFLAIQSQINMMSFILLFAITPIAIYFYVKKIFPK